MKSINVPLGTTIGKVKYDAISKSFKHLLSGTVTESTDISVNVLWDNGVSTSHHPLSLSYKQLCLF